MSQYGLLVSLLRIFGVSNAKFNAPEGFEFCSLLYSNS